eukprot:9495250-Pyramimonas_sp.AAC.1
MGENQEGMDVDGRGVKRGAAGAPSKEVSNGDIFELLQTFQREYRTDREQFNGEIAKVNASVEQVDQKADRALREASEANEAVKQFLVQQKQQASSAASATSKNTRATGTTGIPQGRSTSIDLRKLVIGGFPAYSEQDEMQAAADSILSNHTDNILYRYYASPGNHCTIIWKTEDHMWNWIGEWRKRVKEEDAGDGKASVQIGPTTYRLWAKRHEDKEQRDRKSRLARLKEAFCTLDSTSPFRMVNSQDAIVAYKLPVAGFDDKGELKIKPENFTSAMKTNGVTEDMVKNAYENAVQQKQPSQQRTIPTQNCAGGSGPALRGPVPRGQRHHSFVNVVGLNCCGVSQDTESLRDFLEGNIDGRTIVSAAGGVDVRGCAIVLQRRHKTAMEKPVPSQNPRVQDSHICIGQRQLYLISAYLPQGGDLDEWKKHLGVVYRTIRKQCRRSEMLILSADANCEMGERLGPAEHAYLGCFSQGLRKDRGQVLVEAYVKQHFAVLNTFFPLAGGSTCHSWGDQNGKGTQIDFVFTHADKLGQIDRVWKHHVLATRTDHHMIQ